MDNVDESRAAFEAWVVNRRVWRKYAGTAKPCSLRKNVKGDYLDYRINDRWSAWEACRNMLSVDKSP